MLGVKEEAFVKVIHKSQNDDGEVPLHCPKVFVARAKKADYTVAEGKAEDQEYDHQPQHAHLQHDIKKAVLRLRQYPRHRENHTIRFTLEAKPERLVAIAEQRALGN